MLPSFANTISRFSKVWDDIDKKNDFWIMLFSLYEVNEIVTFWISVKFDNCRYTAILNWLIQKIGNPRLSLCKFYSSFFYIQWSFSLQWKRFCRFSGSNSLTLSQFGNAISEYFEIGDFPNFKAGFKTEPLF